MKPEEAASTLDGLPEEARKAIMTKGIINVFPDPLKTLMLPKQKRRRRSFNDINQQALNSDGEVV